jgi:hypothetical protein
MAGSDIPFLPGGQSGRHHAIKFQLQDYRDSSIRNPQSFIAKRLRLVLKAYICGTFKP